MSDKAQLIPVEVANAARVLAFAQENGFPHADILYWDQDNPECGHVDLHELVEEANVNYRISLGISLGDRGLIARKEWDDDEESGAMTSPPYIIREGGAK